MDSLFRVNRRTFLAGGAAGLFLPARHLFANQSAQNPAAGACVLDAELTQGPYYLDRGILRRNVTEGKQGLPLQLHLSVVDARTCKPVENAALEIWHCDASGIYSGYTKMSPNGFGSAGPHPERAGGPPPEPPPDFDPTAGPPPEFGPHGATDATTFCRGVQLSDRQGAIDFETIYPGWYVSRDTHIHLKVHVGGGITNEKYAGGHVSHTGQLFFPDELSDEVANLKPYVARKDLERTRLSEDSVIGDSHGTPIILAFERIRPSSLEAGLIGTATVRIDPTAIHRDEGPPFRRRPAAA